MPTQQQIDRFTLAFHQEAIARLRADGRLVEQARRTLERWTELLDSGVDSVERTVCKDDELAATLRNASPLGFVLSPAERDALRHASGL
jgi:hypothetical protein